MPPGRSNCQRGEPDSRSDQIKQHDQRERKLNSTQRSIHNVILHIELIHTGDSKNGTVQALLFLGNRIHAVGLTQELYFLHKQVRRSLIQKEVALFRG
jgi:Mlc titration factor MtfA (ptsG expression regulator)